MNFKDLVGKTIEAVDDTCINVVDIKFTDGTIVTVEAVVDPAPPAIPRFLVSRFAPF